jgi:ESCRT-I complex subunit TSG101
MRDADKVIAEAKHRTVPGVDEVLVAPTVVAEQMYELVAEERACVEARGVLNRALDRGRVGVEVWVRNTRGVAREEFLKKALIRKAARGMGLREGEEWG